MIKSKNDPRTRCFILRDNKILAMIREFTPASRTLLLPGGGIDSQESSLDAVKREIKEELNLQVSSDPVYFHTYIQTRPIFPDERTYIHGYENITDVFDFYVYKLRYDEIISVAQEEWEKWLTWGFCSAHQLEDFAKKHNAVMGVGVMDAAKVLMSKHTLWR